MSPLPNLAVARRSRRSARSCGRRAERDPWPAAPRPAATARAGRAMDDEYEEVDPLAAGAGAPRECVACRLSRQGGGWDAEHPDANIVRTCGPAVVGPCKSSSRGPGRRLHTASRDDRLLTIGDRERGSVMRARNLMRRKHRRWLLRCVRHGGRSANGTVQAGLSASAPAAPVDSVHLGSPIGGPGATRSARSVAGSRPTRDWVLGRHVALRRLVGCIGCDPRPRQARGSAVVAEDSGTARCARAVGRLARIDGRTKGFCRVRPIRLRPSCSGHCSAVIEIVGCLGYGDGMDYSLADRNVTDGGGGQGL